MFVRHCKSVCVCVCVCLFVCVRGWCGLTIAFRHNGNFRTQALNAIKIVESSVKSERLASTECLCVVASGQLLILN